MEKQRIRLSLSYVDATTAMSESGRNIRAGQSGGGVGAAVVVVVVLGKIEENKKGLPHRRQKQ